MAKPKEARDRDRKFQVALLAVQELVTISMELGPKDLEEAAHTAHDALLEYEMKRREIT
ncbi:hypothetical protein [Bradyrhizobium sp. ORS 111]|uniref:hypothetical protein n=1 Tax=Bradyrhizobium sp. ORS 111 TaxID=1685958 RepID=UPI00388E61F8